MHRHMRVLRPVEPLRYGIRRQAKDCPFFKFSGIIPAITTGDFPISPYIGFISRQYVTREFELMLQLYSLGRYIYSFFLSSPGTLCY